MKKGRLAGAGLGVLSASPSSAAVVVPWTAGVCALAAGTARPNSETAAKRQPLSANSAPRFAIISHPFAPGAKRPPGPPSSLEIAFRNNENVTRPQGHVGAHIPILQEIVQMQGDAFLLAVRIAHQNCAVSR